MRLLRGVASGCQLGPSLSHYRGPREISAASLAGFLEETVSTPVRALIIQARVPWASFLLLLQGERRGFHAVAHPTTAAFQTKALRVQVPHLSLRSCVNLSKGRNFYEPPFFTCKAGIE